MCWPTSSDENPARHAVLALDVGVTSVQGYGNLYGSSKDVGTIVGRMPTLTETGGRVNRVGFKRLERSATISKMAQPNSPVFQHLRKHLGS